MCKNPIFKIVILLVYILFLNSHQHTQSNKKEKNHKPKHNYITFHKIDKAWQYTKGENTKVAILDWLFDLSHEAKKKYSSPVSMIPGQDIGFAEPWHGEWMAEIVHRIAPAAIIIPIRANPGRVKGDKSMAPEQPYEKYLIKGIKFAAEKGAVAVTNSMGPVKHAQALFDAIDFAETKGTVFINVHPEYKIYTKKELKECEVGECNQKIIHTGLISVPKYPAEPEANRDIYVWPYSIDPKYKDGWGYSNGPPIVGGVVALMRSVNPKVSSKEVKSIIIQTAFIHNGFRVLDAEAAVKEAKRKYKNNK
jgi:hypothetical protein